MDSQSSLLSVKVNAAMDSSALDLVRASLDQTDEAAVASVREAANAAVYEDTIETVLARAEQLAAELDGDLQLQAEDIAAKLARAHT